MSLCVVKSCRHKKTKISCRFHGFPLDTDRCKQWVRVTGEEDFLHLDVETLHNRRFICSCHFTDEDYRTSNRRYLLPGAVPTLFDDDTVPISDEKMKMFLSPNIAIPTGAVLQPLSDVTNRKTPTSAKHTDQALFSNGDEVIQTNNVEMASRSPPTNTTCRSEINNNGNNRKSANANLRTSQNADNITIPSKRYRSSVATKYITRRSILDKAGLKNVPMTPSLKALVSLVIEEKAARKHLELDLEKKTQECESLRAQLKIQEKPVFTNMSSGLKLLSEMEERNYGRKRKGARYTREELSFAIEIYRCSPRCYRFLLQYMDLPSEQTLLRSDSNIETKDALSRVQERDGVEGVQSAYIRLSDGSYVRINTDALLVPSVVLQQQKAPCSVHGGGGVGSVQGAYVGMSDGSYVRINSDALIVPPVKSQKQTATAEDAGINSCAYNAKLASCNSGFSDGTNHDTLSNSRSSGVRETVESEHTKSLNSGTETSVANKDAEGSLDADIGATMFIGAQCELSEENSYDEQTLHSSTPPPFG